MIKSNKNLLLAAMLLISAISFAGCSSASNTANNANAAKPANTNTAANTSTSSTSNAAASNTAVVASADKVGVPECDEYIEKYEACLNSKVPEAQRAAFKTSFDTMRKSWKDTAANPQAKAALASGCKQAHDSAKQAMSSFSCAW